MMVVITRRIAVILVEAALPTKADIAAIAAIPWSAASRQNQCLPVKVEIATKAAISAKAGSQSKEPVE